MKVVSDLIKDNKFSPYVRQAGIRFCIPDDLLSNENYGVCYLISVNNGFYHIERLDSKTELYLPINVISLEAINYDKLIKKDRELVDLYITNNFIDEILDKKTSKICTICNFLFESSYDDEVNCESCCKKIFYLSCAKCAECGSPSFYENDNCASCGSNRISVNGVAEKLLESEDE